MFSYDFSEKHKAYAENQNKCKNWKYTKLKWSCNVSKHQNLMLIIQNLQNKAALSMTWNVCRKQQPITQAKQNTPTVMPPIYYEGKLQQMQRIE